MTLKLLNLFKKKYTFSNKYDIVFPTCKEKVDSSPLIESVQLRVKNVVMYEKFFTKPVIVQESLSPVFRVGELKIETEKHDADIFLQIKDQLSVHLFDNQGKETTYPGYEPCFSPISFQLN